MKAKIVMHKSSGVNRPICDGNGRMKKPRISVVASEITCARCLKMMAAGVARATAAAAKESEINAEFAARCLVRR